MGLLAFNHWHGHLSLPPKAFSFKETTELNIFEHLQIIACKTKTSFPLKLGILSTKQLK
jgi:hypothetical protein